MQPRAVHELVDRGVVEPSLPEDIHCPAQSLFGASAFHYDQPPVEQSFLITEYSFCQAIRGRPIRSSPSRSTGNPVGGWLPGVYGRRSRRSDWTSWTHAGAVSPSQYLYGLPVGVAASYSLGAIWVDRPLNHSRYSSSSMTRDSSRWPTS